LSATALIHKIHNDEPPGVEAAHKAVTAPGVSRVKNVAVAGGFGIKRTNAWKEAQSAFPKT
jgi:hypothetical protein